MRLFWLWWLWWLLSSVLWRLLLVWLWRLLLLSWRLLGRRRVLFGIRLRPCGIRFDWDLPRLRLRALGIRLGGLLCRFLLALKLLKVVLELL